MQAVKTNVVANHDVIEAAGAVSVRSVVCFSTDEAMCPSGLIMTGLDAQDAVGVVSVATAGKHAEHSVSAVPPNDYMIDNTDTRIRNFTLFTAGRHAGWAGLRR